VICRLIAGKVLGGHSNTHHCHHNQNPQKAQQMAFRMVALNRLPNGQFFTRKVIPVDVRDA
jgi:hypothetical protein